MAAGGGRWYWRWTDGNEFKDVTLEITKKDANSGSILPGALFQLRDINKNACTDPIVTGSNGKCSFTIKSPGTYYIYETGAPAGYDLTKQINYQEGYGSYRGFIVVDSAGGYTATYYGDFENKGANSLSIILYNNKNPGGDVGGFKITKKDSSDNSVLPGVWIFITKENKTIGWDNYSTCVDWGKTNSSGVKSFQNLEAGKYYVWELNQRTGYYNKFQKIGYVEVTSGNNNCTLTEEGASDRYIRTDGNTVYNIQYRNLRIKKIDKDTEKPISGIVFKIYSRDQKQWISMQGSALRYSYLYDNATEFETGPNGLTSEIRDLPLGEYDIYEVKLGPNSNIYKLGTVGNVPIEENKTGTIRAYKRSCTLSRIDNGKTKLVQYTWANKQAYVYLSGYVWVDKQSSKQSRRNDLYKTNYLYETNSTAYTDDKDIRLNDVTVKLKKTDGTVVQTTTTANGGMYTFQKVSASDLSNGYYYIEFEYNGLKYTNVTPHIERDTGSKAKEGNSRTTFNNNFNVIEGGENTSGTKNAEYGYTKDANGNKKYDLTYTKSGYKSTLNDSNSFLISSNTNSAGFYLKDYFTYGSTTTEKVKQISKINLGLYEREQPDIAIVQDIQNVKLGIDNYWHTYNYSSRFKDILSTEDRYDTAVKFGTKYGNKTYSRAIYEADYNYKNESNSENELQAYITYKITIKNQATSLQANVYNVNYYFDKRFDTGDIVVGTKLDDNTGEITDIDKVVTLDGVRDINNNKTITVSDVGDYNKVTIYLREKNTETGTIDNIVRRIKSSESADIYIRFKLKRDTIASIVNNEEDDISNVAEIKNYSIYDRNNNIYAGVDEDSNPNNCTPGVKSTYEDDTDYAPGFGIILQSERTTEGKVFLDATTGELSSGNIRQGDGEFKPEVGEKGIPNVEVTMYKKINGTASVAKVYDYATDTWKDAKTITDINGNYKIGGYLPGEYYIVFTWGDKTYKVQDYKGTVQDKAAWDANAQNQEWYKTQFPRYSDAQDDWVTRVAIDDQTRLMTNSNREAIKTYYNAKITKTNMAQEDLITKMNSTTIPFRVNLEYSTRATNSINEYELNKDGTIKMNGKYVVKKAGYKNEIKNIDFGIVERARQIVQLEKVIKSAKVTLASQSVLINVILNENGQITNKPQYVTYVPKSAGAEALLKFEIDQELIHGATLEIEYGLKAANVSELDYIDQNFYKYGIVPTEKPQVKMVTLTPNNIIDYLDYNISVDMNQNAGWNLLSNADSINNLGLLSESAANNAKTNLKNGIIKVLEKNNISTGLKPVDNTATTNVNETFIESSLKCTKLLAESDQSILENYAEIIKVTKTGGATLQTTPGNYIPRDSSTAELDNANSGPLEIIPPTGLNKNSIAFILLAISLFGILGGGIVLIRKYVIN